MASKPATPTIGREGAVIIGDIEGGEAPSRIDMDDNLTADHLYDTYRRYPTYKSIIKLDVEAVWSNYLNQEAIQTDRLLELKDGMEDCINYGWEAYVIDATTKPPRVERWHIKIDGTGFEVTKTSQMGMPLEIQIQARFTEASTPINYRVEHYPCEIQEIVVGQLEDGTPIISNEYIRERPIPGQRGFFLIRNRGGKKGVRGLPKYLDLIMLIRKAYDIVETYAVYAENQALATMFVGMKHNTAPNRDSIKTQIELPTHRKLIMMGNEDWANWESGMNSSWDPWSMLEYIDKLVARDTQLNKLMLEGDPAGYLSASETAINNWETKVKERQAYWLGQFLPIFLALGATKEIAFKDPSKPAFISLMTGLQACREAMIDIVSNEDIVKLFNEYLNKHGFSEELTAISNEDMNQNTMNEEGNNDKDSESSED